jgi:hypothetical protein
MLSHLPRITPVASAPRRPSRKVLGRRLVSHLSLCWRDCGQYYFQCCTHVPDAQRGRLHTDSLAENAGSARRTVAVRVDGPAGRDRIAFLMVTEPYEELQP